MSAQTPNLIEQCLPTKQLAFKFLLHYSRVLVICGVRFRAYCGLNDIQYLTARRLIISFLIRLHHQYRFSCIRWLYAF
ncbi:hypothetical protein V2G26_006044 [Clonostachys chloroleuca]